MEATAKHAEHGIGRYVVVWAILLTLLVVSLFLGHLSNVYLMNALVFGVALIKASLVVTYFMGIRMEPKVIVVTLIITVLFMVGLLAGVSPDVTFNPSAAPTPL